MALIRRAVESDYYNGHVEILKQLSDTIDKLTIEQYKYLIDSECSNTHVFVLESESKVMGSITVLIEQKLIHNFGRVAHIEDVVVGNEYRGKNYGKLLVDFAVNFAKTKGCYKVILNCNDSVKSFYEKLGFVYKNHQMAIYFS